MSALGIGVLVVTSVVALPTILNRFCKLLFLFVAKAFRPLPNGPTDSAPRPLPRVAVQVAISNEPPDIVLTTLASLDGLDYPDFLVQVIDNNTSDEQLWRPVETFCNQRPQRFVFYHVERLAGYKAGALQFALQRVPPDAELIAIVDADNIVQARFLRDVVPHFVDPSVAIVQSPLGFVHDPRGERFASWIFLIYRYFLSIYMPACARLRCAPFIGGMGIVRRAALEHVGGWDGFYLAEDMELSGRLFSAGLVSKYVDYPHGRTMPPNTFGGLKRQHYRWSFGNSQILRDRLWRSFTTRWGAGRGWLRRLFYFTCPGIYLNLHFLPFVLVASLVRIGEAFQQTDSIADLACRIMLWLLAIELTGEAIMFAVLGWSEGAGMLSTCKNYAAWWSLAVNNSWSTWSVAFRKTRPFEVTEKSLAPSKSRNKATVPEFALAVAAFGVALAPAIAGVSACTPASATLLLIASICATGPIVAWFGR